MALREVVIDERTLSEAGEPRRREWESTIRELLEPGQLVIRDDAHRLLVTLTEQGTLLDLRNADDETIARVSVPKDALADHITEYVDIVRQIAKEDAPGHLSRLEALDMAKKVTHDRAGRTLKRLCKEMGLDLATARRLFTLLLSLRVDTTKLVGIHGHRRVK